MRDLGFFYLTTAVARSRGGKFSTPTPVYLFFAPTSKKPFLLTLRGDSFVFSLLKTEKQESLSHEKQNH